MLDPSSRSSLPSRRLVLSAVSAAAALPALRAQAAEPVVYNGWRFDASALPAAPSEAVVRSLHSQCDIVDGLRIKPEAAAFFRAQPLILVEASRGGSGDYQFGERSLHMVAKVDPPENPVLLHELLHAYHDQVLGRRNPRLVELYAKTGASGGFPAEAYMLKNPAEFFAMCASVSLWGRAARPPLTRDNLRAKAPEVYAWVAELFDFHA